MQALPNTSRIVPSGDWVVVKADPVEAPDQSEGGILYADISKPVAIKRIGTVLDVGPMAVRCKEGERILFMAHAGTTVNVQGEELELMQDGAKMASLEE